jgi:hypothetical protein
MRTSVGVRTAVRLESASFRFALASIYHSTDSTVDSLWASGPLLPFVARLTALLSETLCLSGRLK